MEIMSYFAQDAQGNIMPSADCYLYAPGTTNLVSGLVDVSGAPLSNPFQASNIGKVQFGAPNGVYDLRIKKGARDTTIRIQCADLLQALNETASFLGARATAPATRADGTPLQLADRYLNTTDQLEYLYKSAGWVVNNVDGQILATSAGASMVGAIMQDGTTGTVQQAINIGDNSLRQDLSGAAGAALLGYGTSTVAKELDKTFKDATAFFASARPFVAGDRVSTRSGEAWDIVAAGAGEQNHPVTGMGVIAVAKANAFMVARSYDVHRSNSGARNYAGIQLALDKLGNRDAGALELPYANEFAAIQVAGNIAVPENVKLSGSSWRTCCLVFTTANGGITFGSSSIIEDMDLRGGQVASIGITERGEFNRASISRVRIQDFKQWNLAIGMHGAANNSLFTDIQMKFANEANLALGQSLNNTFSQTNGDLSATAPTTARGIRVYDLFPGSSDSNKQCRNTKFVKGIYERGFCTYQLEVERATGLSFDGTEFNNGSIATCQIKKGSMQMYSPFFSLNGTNDILHADNASDVRIYTPIVSGSSGRALSEMLEGPVQVDGSLAYPTMARNLRWLPLTPSGNATSDTSPAIGTRATSATGTTANRVSSGSTSGVTTAGQSRIWEATVSVSAIASGVVKVYLQVTTSPFRILMGTLAVGVNRFSVPTSLPSLGALDFIGDGAFDITFLTAKTESF